MKSILYILLISLFPVLATAQASDSTKVSRRAKLGGVLKKVGAGLSAVGQQTAGALSQAAGNLIANQNSGIRPQTIRGNCLKGDCKNGYGALRYMVDDRQFVVYHGSFKNGKLDGLVKCYESEIQTIDGNAAWVWGGNEAFGHSMPAFETEFIDGKPTGKGKVYYSTTRGGVSSLMGGTIGGKPCLSSHYEGEINIAGQPDGVGNYYYDSCHNLYQTKIPLLYGDSVVSTKGTRKSAKRELIYNFGKAEKPTSIVLNPTYEVYPSSNFAHGTNLPTFIASGKEIKYHPDGKIAQETVFKDNGSSSTNRRTDISTTIYLPDGSIGYSGPADTYSLHAAQGVCINGNCKTGEGTFRWVANICENYEANQTESKTALLVTKGKFQNGVPIGKHQVTTSLGSVFEGELTSQFKFKYGIVRQGNGSFKGGFGEYNCNPKGGIWMYKGVSPNDPLHSVAGLAIGVVKASGGTQILNNVTTSVAQQFSRDMHLGTIDEDYTFLEPPIRLILIDSSATVDQLALTYKIVWGSQNEQLTTIRAVSNYDSNRDDIHFDYTILNENDAAKTWRMKALQYESSQLQKLGVQKPATKIENGKLIAKLGKNILWKSETSWATETEDVYVGTDERGRDYYKKEQFKRADRYLIMVPKNWTGKIT
jgi:antitoxin component YwqK of YwqJK toxin-antitoxin module